MNMADIKDVSTTIESALNEVGLTGKLNVDMDGKHVVAPVGDVTGHPVEVHVEVVDAEPGEPPAD
jgi:ethanolamine utilization protein EutQ (cupin superfamily)